MPTPPLTPEELERTKHALDECNWNKSRAARMLDIKRTTLQSRIKSMERDGYFNNPDQVKEVTKRLDKSGQVIGQSIKYVQRKSSRIEDITDQPLKASSILTDASGNVVQAWHKVEKEANDPAKVAEIIKDAFADFKPFAPAIVRQRGHQSEALNTAVACDWHIGARVTRWNGDWSLSAAVDKLVNGYVKMIDGMAQTEEFLFLGLGDLSEADNEDGTTPAHKHILNPQDDIEDVIPALQSALLAIFEHARAKFKRIQIVLLEGNHDPILSACLRSSFAMYYRNVPYVDVWSRDGYRFYREFGVNSIGGTHGHKEKLTDLPMIMANECSDSWSGKTVKEWHTGHRHSDRVIDIHGVRVIIHGPAVPSGKYAGGMGLTSRLSLRGYEYSLDGSETGTREILL